MMDLYCDGGVIGKNPSPIGGTWAVCVVSDGIAVVERSGVITPAQACMPAITNNLTEMLALVRGLDCMPDNWTGTVYSDSQITLGRVFESWKWTHIPDWLRHDFVKQRFRLKEWFKIRHVLLDGHPTKAQLEQGLGKRGHPVSEHNVACDRLCGEAGREFLEKLKA